MSDMSGKLPMTQCGSEYTLLEKAEGYAGAAAQAGGAAAVLLGGATAAVAAPMALAGPIGGPAAAVAIGVGTGVGAAVGVVIGVGGEKKIISTHDKNVRACKIHGPPGP